MSQTAPIDPRNPLDPVRLARGKFLAMAGTYSLGVFNDNFFKQAACLLAIAGGRAELQGYAGGLFALPFILFAAPAGFLADRFAKRHVVIAAKALELAAMICGAIGICIGNWPLMLIMVFTMGLQATIFGPALNGSIPELYPASYVLKANSVLKTATTVAILLGIIFACVALGQKQVSWHGIAAGRLIVAGGVLAMSALGLLLSLWVPSRPPANPAAKFPWTGPADTVRALAGLRTDRLLAGTVILDAYVWFAAALDVFIINRLGMSQFQMDESNISFLQVPLLAGVAAGGLACGRLATSDRWHRVLAPAALAMGSALLLIALVPLLPEHIGISAAALALSKIYPQIIASCLLLFFTGAAGGILLVPLEAFIQARPPADRKGQIIAAANCTAFIGILLAGLAFNVLDRFMRPTAAFGVLGGLTMLAGLVVCIRPLRDKDL